MKGDQTCSTGKPWGWRREWWNAVGIYLLALAPLIWTNNETIVGWLLARRIVQEAATRTLPSAVAYLAIAVGAVGLLAARSLFVRAALAVRRWQPVRAVGVQAAGALKPAGALFGYLWALSWTGLYLLCFGFYVVFRCLWLGLYTIAVAVALGLLTLSAVLGYLLAGVLHYVWLAVAGAAWVAFLMLRYLWLGLSVPLGLLWQAVFAVSRLMGYGLSVAARAVWVVIVAGLYCLWFVFTAAALAAGLALRSVQWTFRRAWRPASAVVRFLWWGHSTLGLLIGLMLRHLWRAICAATYAVALVLCCLWLGIFRVLGFLWLGVDSAARGLGLPLRYLLLAISVVVRLAWSGVALTVWGVGLALRLLRLGLAALHRLVGQGLATGMRVLWRVVSEAARAVGLVLGYLLLGISIVLHVLWLGLSTGFRACSWGFRVLARAVGLAVRDIWQLIAHRLLPTIGRGVWMAVSTLLRGFWLPASVVGVATGLTLTLLWDGLCVVARVLWLGISTACRYLWLGISEVARAVGLVLGYLWVGVSAVHHSLRAGFTAALRYVSSGLASAAEVVGFVLQLLWLGVSTVLGYFWSGTRTVLAPVGFGSALGLKYLWLGLSTIVLTAVWVLGGLGLAMLVLVRKLGAIPTFVLRTMRTGCSAALDIWRMLVWIINRKGVPSMSEFNLTRERVLSLIATVWLFGTVGFFVAAMVWPAPPEPTVVVTQWANGHVTRPSLLIDMARRFNQAGPRTASGKRIEVQVYNYGSAEQVKDLVSRAARGVPLEAKYPDPTIVTPSADHWLVQANQDAGRPVVNFEATRSIARTWIGIVTYREMAECLGWPNKEIGYADIIALRNDPRGWASYPCARAEWGQRPLVAYTDPDTSSTGRSVLFSLYAIAAGKPPDRLTAADVASPEVVGYVKGFQQLVDHYQVGTIPLNTKAVQGPRYSHFLLMPEDNLIHLYQGTEYCNCGGKQTKAPPLSRPMVMIYPKEGSTAHNHSASRVEAPWVSPEQVEAARTWVAYLHEDDQQRAFMAAGFRPVTDLALDEPISGRYGLDPAKPTVVVNPDRIDQAAAMGIIKSWQDVKRPAIVTFVVDTSGSMLGGKLQQAKDGLIRALDNMARNNQVGLLTFDDRVNARTPVGPLTSNRFVIAGAVQEMRARGETALYDAVRAGVEMTDEAPGDHEAIRGVVVLTDGQANRGATRLDGLVKMMSSNETAIRQFGGFKDDSQAVEVGGRKVKRQEVIGVGLALETRHPIQVFFIGIGGDADMEIGRVLAEATGAEFQASTEKDLANVLEQFSKYF